MKRPAPLGTCRSLSLQDAALALGVSRRTIYYRIRDGRLHTVRTRGGSQRVLRWSLEKLLLEHHDLGPAGGIGVADPLTA